MVRRHSSTYVSTFSRHISLNLSTRSSQRVMVVAVGRLMPNLDGAAQQKRDKSLSIALSGAQRLLDTGHVDDARALLCELAEYPSTPIRAHACLLAAGVHLMCG